MRTFYETDIRKRTLVVGLALTAWFTLVLVRLVDLQAVRHPGFKARAERQSQARVVVRARRGDILDRNGKVLAASLPVYSVKLSPVEKETAAQEEQKVRRLKEVLGLSDREAADILKSVRGDDAFTYVKRQVPQELAARVRELKLAGVGFDEENLRIYPNGGLAAHILGGVNAEGAGRAGVELRYDDILRGRDGEQVALLDNKRRSYQSQLLKPPVPGQDIVLTIDAAVQYMTERALATAIRDHRASSGTIIVLDPRTGDILALANWPAYDPNRYTESREAWLDRAIGYTYEPGSTFKIVAAAAALEKGLVRWSDVFDCTAGSIKVGPLTISDHERMGILDFPKVLIDSSNVGTVKIAQRLSMADLYEMIRRFGFGRKSGVDLPAEEPGLVYPVARWNKVVSLPHIAIGYEIGVTPLQVLRAMNVFAAGGRLVRPRVVLKAPAGQAVSVIGPSPDDTVLAPDLAEALTRRVFEQVVEQGTAKEGRMTEFWVAGKTGTAQKLDPVLKTYTTKSHTASFVGFVPARRPVLSMVVVLDDPKEGFYYGGQVCAPIFRDLARQVLRYLGVTPDRSLTDGVVTAGLVRKERT